MNEHGLTSHPHATLRSPVRSVCSSTARGNLTGIADLTRSDRDVDVPPPRLTSAAVPPSTSLLQEPRLVSFFPSHPTSRSFIKPLAPPARQTSKPTLLPAHCLLGPQHPPYTWIRAPAPTLALTPPSPQSRGPQPPLRSAETPGSAPCFNSFTYPIKPEHLAGVRQAPLTPPGLPAPFLPSPPLALASPAFPLPPRAPSEPVPSFLPETLVQISAGPPRYRFQDRLLVSDAAASEGSTPATLSEAAAPSQPMPRVLSSPGSCPIVSHSFCGLL